MATLGLTTGSKVPLEVIESIIDCLSAIDNESFSSLKACSLVSRNLLPRARKHIFSSVTVRGVHKSHGPQAFACLIEEAPEIAECIISLHYAVTIGDLGAVGFGSALGRLTRLKSLTISSPSLKWKNLPFKETILNLMHLPTLAHLKIAGMKGFHLSDLTLCANLKSLKMVNLGHVEVGGDIAMYQEQPPSLDSYTYKVGNWNHRLLRSLCTARRMDGKPIVNISGLKKLSLQVNPKEADAIEKLFSMCTQLTRVYLFGGEHLLVTTGFTSLFLHSIQTLRHIDIDFGFYASHDTFRLLVSEFASLTSKTVIETIQISIDVLGYGGEGHGGYLVDDTWCALDQVFNQSNAGWRKLRTFSINISVHIDSFEEGYLLDEPDPLMEYFLALPHTHLRGIASNEGIRFHWHIILAFLPVQELRQLNESFKLYNSQTSWTEQYVEAGSHILRQGP